QRADFASPGHPGLDVSFQNRGSNTLTGEFTITEVTFMTGPAGLEVETFAASFEQHSEGAAPALFGDFTYDARITAVPEPGTFALALVRLLPPLTQLRPRRKTQWTDRHAPGSHTH